MLELFSDLRDFTFSAVVVRLFIAFICGGLIGLERAYKRRPAGFRTHILICLGAAMTTLTSQYWAVLLNYPTDLARLGAQVIAGIGFIGAGTIIVTKRQRVKGLTTAAGLWLSAIIGLVLGSGYYEAGILATLLVLIAEFFFAKIEYRVLYNSPRLNLYIEYKEKKSLEAIIFLCTELDLKIANLEVTRQPDVDGKHTASVIMTLIRNKNMPVQPILQKISELNGVILVDKL